MLCYDIHTSRQDTDLSNHSRCFMAFIQGMHLEVKAVQPKNLSIDEKKMEGVRLHGKRAYCRQQVHK